MKITSSIGLIFLYVLSASFSLSASYTAQIKEVEAFPREKEAIISRKTEVKTINTLREENLNPYSLQHGLLSCAFNHYKIALLISEVITNSDVMRNHHFAKVLSFYEKWSFSHKASPLQFWEYKLLNFPIESYIALSKSGKMKDPNLLPTLLKNLLPKERINHALIIVEQAIRQENTIPFHKAMFQLLPPTTEDLLHKGYINHYVTTYGKNTPLQEEIKTISSLWLLPQIFALYRTYGEEQAPLKRLKKEKEVWFLMTMAVLYQDTPKHFSTAMEQIGCTTEKIKEVVQSFMATQQDQAPNPLIFSILHDVALFEQHLIHPKLNLTTTTLYKKMKKKSYVAWSARLKIMHLFTTYKKHIKALENQPHRPIQLDFLQKKEKRETESPFPQQEHKITEKNLRSTLQNTSDILKKYALPGTIVFTLFLTCLFFLYKEGIIFSFASKKTKKKASQKKIKKKRARKPKKNQRNLTLAATGKRIHLSRFATKNPIK